MDLKLKIFIAAFSYLLHGTLIAESVRIGNGTTGLRVKEGNVVLDVVERGQMLDITEQPSYKNFVKPRLEDLSSILPLTGRYLTSIFEERENSYNRKLTPRWFMVQLPLANTEDRGASPVSVTGYDTVQMAVNSGSEIFVNEPETRALNHRDFGFLLMHEALISSFGYDRPLRDTAAIRSLNARLMQEQIYNTNPKTLCRELLEVLKDHSRSSLYAMIEADLSNIKDVRRPVADIDGFVEECTSAKAESSLHDTYLILFHAAGKTDTLPTSPRSKKFSAPDCRSVFRMLWAKSTLELNAYSWMGNNFTVHRVYISDVTPLRFFTATVNLDLSSHSIKSVQALSGLTALRVLNLGWNEIQDVKSLNALRNLDSLSLSGNDIVDIDGVSLPKLKFLHLSSNLLSQNLTDFEAPELRQINLAHNRLKSEDLEFLKKFPKLRSVTLQNNLVDDLSFVGSKWEHLYLTSNNVQTLKGLPANSALRTLSLSYNPVKTLSGRDLPNSLEDLTLVGDTSISHLEVDETWPTLKFLNLNASNITKYSFRHPDASLRYLYAGFDSKFDFTLVKTSPYFKNLISLDVSSGTPFMKDGVPHSKYRPSFPNEFYQNFWGLFDLQCLVVPYGQDISNLSREVFYNLIRPHVSRTDPTQKVQLNIVNPSSFDYLTCYRK